MAEGNVEEAKIVGESTPNLSENETSTSDQFWENLSDPEQDLSTFVWLVGLVFDIDSEPTRAFVTARSKEAAVNKICQILASDDLTKHSGLNPQDYDNALDFMRAYFDGSENRDVFMMLCPLE